MLCDCDPTCGGPWQVDLVAVAVGEARFGRAGAHKQLAAAYGYDVTTDPGWPLLREARELKMVVAAVPLLASTPESPPSSTLAWSPSVVTITAPAGRHSPTCATDETSLRLIGTPAR